MNRIADFGADRLDEDPVMVDASEIAPLLGLTPERLMAELRAGHIYQTAEERPGEDDDLMFLTFRFRAKVARMIVGPDGSIRPEEGHTH